MNGLQLAIDIALVIAILLAKAFTIQVATQIQGRIDRVERRIDRAERRIDALRIDLDEQKEEE